MPEQKDSCVKPARGPILPSTNPEKLTAALNEERLEMNARVGHEAPDFEANAFVAGSGFLPVKLSDYKGKWIVLCFYPGDFTFV